ncbi:MAG: hypothetical protein KKB20_10965 [Proteobacteria bacterium]|nr:hypothetical protein [Pseudomonadota bacterium]
MRAGILFDDEQFVLTRGTDLSDRRGSPDMGAGVFESWLLRYRQALGKSRPADDPSLLFCPIRRLGRPGQPDPPSPYRPSLVFMAAAPRGRSPLRYEDEETAILTATGNLGMDLGHLLCAGGYKEDGLAILRRSEEGFRTLDRTDRADQIATLIAEITGKAPA